MGPRKKEEKKKHQSEGAKSADPLSNVVSSARQHNTTTHCTGVHTKVSWRYEEKEAAPPEEQEEDKISVCRDKKMN